MALPVVESSTSGTAASASGITLTKPTGLAVGNWLIAHIFFTAGSTRTFTVPAGWTQTPAEALMSDTLRRYTVFYKTADAGDVAASNFTFNLSGSADTINGILVRVSNVARLEDFEFDANTPSSTTVSFTGDSTPLTTDSLVMMGIAAYSGAGDATVSAYTTTPSKTFTEVQDIFLDSGTTDPVLAVATAPSGSTAQITAYGATLSISKVQHGGSLLILTPPTSPVVDIEHVSVTPAIENITASQVNVAVTVDMATITPAITDIDTRTVSPTVWTNEAPETTVWTNETL